MADVETLYDHYFLEYATYVVKNRAIPEIDDGLKPVQRRILHTLFEIDDGKYHKVANVVGQTMRFHPHGDQSIFGALVSLANKDLFIDKQGNFGSVLTGGQASAARYIECRLTPLAREVLLSPEITEYVDSYDGRAREPVVFPAKVPVALILGAEGIAVGMSTRILPHNPIEVMEAQVSCLKGEPFHLYPDFPTGGLMDVSEYEDGNGRVYTRARLEPRDDGVVMVRALPFGETTESLMKSIEEAARSKRIAVSGLNDYTTDDVEIEIRTDPDTETAEIDDILRGLYAFTSCEVTLSANLLVISDGHPRVMTVTDMIRHSTNRLLEILAAELKIEERDLRARLRARRLEQVFIENRIYKDIEDIDNIEGVYAAVREAIARYSPVSTTARAVDRGMIELNDAPAEIRDAARSLLTTVYRSLDFEHYGPSREMIARNLDAVGHGPEAHRRLVRSLLAAIRHELTATRRMAAVEDIITADSLTTADLDRLLDIPIFRITRYGIDRAEAEMREIESQLRTVLHNLHHLTDFAIDFLEQLIRGYRDEHPRRSEVKPFTPVQERDAATRDLVLRYDTESGYMGYTIESGKPLFNVSLYDRVVIVRSGGVAGVHNTLDKMYVDLDILYCAMEEPGRVFTVAYRDLEGYACIKRCTMDRCRINQLYELVPGDSELLDFTAEVDPEIVVTLGDVAVEELKQGAGEDSTDQESLQDREVRETGEYLKADDFPIRSHRARGDRIERTDVVSVEFVINNSINQER
ncbi:MAG: hypothetical protein F4Y38_06400 [Gemmatimonadetes bacterium]|nr:hypothetical protein [Gemmatimonadota bacterium]MYG85081.1 hypothetical protein [Gemmatimonadota bacterium]MYJ91060.1 hypothetical protein [Gemmatimonadota bacterium]